MATSIRTNLMAWNTARTLGAHYARLSRSVRRLSSGLRINSAADDAAGLAIRELMRADVATLNQGIRNANDAISMIQVADGALAVIDEKLIRMKELAEQAATGTYNSTQRLMIESEYQAMAAEIDRIANATDFNGIKLLDGSLSGAHNGRGLNATGAMKIHFGTGNDSAEDYYYISIGACTTSALGLGRAPAVASPSGTYVKKEGFIQQQQTFKPSPNNMYIEYTDPDTGDKYYSDGDFYFSSVYNPAGTTLNWETEGNIIERLRTTQDQTYSGLEYNVFVDPVTNAEYFVGTSWNSGYLFDAHDPDRKKLDPNNPAEKAVIDRLQNQNKTIRVLMYWDNYLDENGRRFYSRDNGQTFLQNLKNPDTVVYDRNNPAHQEAIAKLKPELVGKKVSKPVTSIFYPIYRDPVTGTLAYSLDGKTFVRDVKNPDSTKIDPVAEKDFLARLVPEPTYEYVSFHYGTYYCMDGGQKIYYYTRDGGQTFTTDTGKPWQIDLSATNPADAVKLAQLQPELTIDTRITIYKVYEDPNNNNKKYYTKDNGQTFSADFNDPVGSALDNTDPADKAIIDRLINVNTTEAVDVNYIRYDDTDGTSYWTSDGGLTFVTDYHKPDTVALDSTNAAHAAIIGRLKLHPRNSNRDIPYDVYTDPYNNDKRYYTLHGGPRTTYIDNKYKVDTIVLDSSNPTQKDIIDRLQPVQATEMVNTHYSFPDIYYVYEDGRNGTLYYSYDGGKTFTSSAYNPYEPSDILDPSSPADKAVLNNLKPHTTAVKGEYYVWEETGGTVVPGASISLSTQEAAQKALVAIDNAIVSKDTIRAHLGALQNRLENTVTNLSIQAENLQASESRISDTDVASEMTLFVRNQVLTQSAVAMLSQANSFPHMLMSLLQG